MSPSVRLHPRAAPHPLAAPYGATQPAAAPPAPPAGRRFAYVTLLTKCAARAPLAVACLPGVQALARQLLRLVLPPIAPNIHRLVPPPCRDGYLPGVQALARSLRLVGGRYPMIVMYTKGVG